MEKRRVELQTSSLNRSSGSGGGEAVTNCVLGSVMIPKQVTDQGQDVYKLSRRSVVDRMDRKYAASLLTSKAKFGPLAHIGETYRNELCCAHLCSSIKAVDYTEF